MTEIRITVRNETNPGGLFLTPVWFGLHDGSFDLFDMGDTASAGLEGLAEDGSVAGITGEFATATGGTGVSGTISGLFGAADVLDPLDMGTTILDVDPSDQRYLHLGSMVIPSNDAFIGTDDGIELFDDTGAFIGPLDIAFSGQDVLDAGTEANTETDAAFINQAAPDSGTATSAPIALHPGFIGSENGPAVGPNGEPTTILGGTTATGAVIDPEVGDFTRDGYKLATVHINVVETQVGTSGADLIEGGSADQIVYGLGGSDQIATGTGWDVIFGGNGDDEIQSGRGQDIVVGGEGDDVIDAERGDDIVFGGAGRDSILLGSRNDLAYGDIGSDEIFGGGGDDILIGGGGWDDLNGGNGLDLLIGGGGNDSLRGGKSRDWLVGGNGDDTLFGGDGNDLLWGGSGDDFLTGGGGRNSIVTGDGEDIVFLSGGGANDRVSDFDLVFDLIMVSVAGIDDIADLTISGGASTRIEYDGSQVELVGVASADLTADHFLFG